MRSRAAGRGRRARRLTTPTRGGGGAPGKRLLVNVARGKEARQSAGGAEAAGEAAAADDGDSWCDEKESAGAGAGWGPELAVDGSRQARPGPARRDTARRPPRVTRAAAARAQVFFGRAPCRGAAAPDAAPAGAPLWAACGGAAARAAWCVDLGAPRAVRAVDVWTGRRARGRRAYPAAADAPAVPLALRLFDAAGAEVGHHALPPPAAGVASAAGLLGARARFLRVEAAGGAGGAGGARGAGRMELVEVEVWADEAWRCAERCVRGSCERAGAGAGAREVCVCEADWAGRDCDVMLMATWAFLPLQAAVARGGAEGGAGGGAADWWEPELAAEAWRALADTQHLNPPDCDPECAARLRPTPPPGPAAPRRVPFPCPPPPPPGSWRGAPCAASRARP